VPETLTGKRGEKSLKTTPSGGGSRKNAYDGRWGGTRCFETTERDWLNHVPIGGGGRQDYRPDLEEDTVSVEASGQPV